MRMEPPVTQGWRKIIVPYRLLPDPYHLGFSFEAVGRLPEEPRLWIETDTAVIHHSPGLFILLPGLTDDLIEEISKRDTILITEQYRRHYNEVITPWGMDRLGGDGHTYSVPVIHTEKIGDIRKIFNALPDGSPDESPIGE